MTPMTELARMVDANANRAREALRTMEDLARFRQSDGVLSGRFKALRHGLRAALAAYPGGEAVLYAHRDTPGDPGTGVKAPDEGERGGPRAIAIAAGRRAGEALRVLEECLKPAVSAEAWLLVERLRYELYALEASLVLALGTGRAPQWRLCILITEALCRRPWLEVAREAVLGGADCVQLREPAMADGALLDRAGALRAELDDAGAARGDAGHRTALIINNRVDVALLCGADGVHLGVEDLPIPDARRLCGDALLIGASTHDLDEARRAVAAGADYCGVGAMFAGTTKVRTPSGPTYLRDYLADQALARVPHLAIGGITPENIGELTAAGGLGVAVSGVVCGAERPREICEAMLGRLSEPAPNGAHLTRR